MPSFYHRRTCWANGASSGSDRSDFGLPWSARGSQHSFSTARLIVLYAGSYYTATGPGTNEVGSPVVQGLSTPHNSYAHHLEPSGLRLAQDGCCSEAQLADLIFGLKADHNPRPSRWTVPEMQGRRVWQRRF
jgi:hypothetical protein